MRQGELKQALSLFSVFALALGATLGWGTWTLPGDWLRMSGALGVVVAVLVAKAVLAPVVFAYGKLMSVLPCAGGELL